MTGRSSPKWGRVTASVQSLADSGLDGTAIRAALFPVYGRNAVDRAIARAYAADVLPRPPRKNPERLSIKLPGAAGARLAARAAAEGLTPAALAKIILHRASRSIDTMELHL